MTLRAAHRHKTKKYGSSKKPQKLRLSLELLEDRLTPVTAVVPTVTSPVFTSLTPNSAVLGGNVASNGGLTTSLRGVVYSLTSVNNDPKLGGDSVKEVDAPPYADMGVFYVTVGPLLATKGYSFKAFAINPIGTSYSPVATFTPPTGIVMPPNSTSKPNDVLFFQPTQGQKVPGTDILIPAIPTKQVTLTNNLTTTVYPFLRDAAATVDEVSTADNANPKIYQGFYDPIDQMNEEYRGYIGYSVGGVNYLGLLPGMSITVNIPLVFWDGARLEIGTDGTYLLNNAQVGASVQIPNPYQSYDKNVDGSSVARIALPAAGQSGVDSGTKGMVMWYRQGLNNQTDRSKPAEEQAKAPVNDAPAQLAEWTIRDPVLAIINPNIEKVKLNSGETHALVNYDVSYVDSMQLPVAMEALDVPIPVTPQPELDKKNPNPGPSLPYGWIGAAQTPAEFQASMASFTSDGQQNGLGDYFGGKGWPIYNMPSSAYPAGQPLAKIPAGQNVPADTPLADKSSSYDILANLYLLSSGGTGFKAVAGGIAAYSDGSSKFYLRANADDKPKLEQALQRGMVIANSESGAPDIPPGTTIKTIGENDKGFVYSTFNGQPVLEVGLSSSIATSGTRAFGYTATRQRADYATTALVNLWYTWAKYYVDHVNSKPAPDLPGKSLSTDAGKLDNVIKLTNVSKGVLDGLKPGMLVTGNDKSGIRPLRADGTGATTILSIDSDGTIHLSQTVGLSTDGATYSFAAPTMSSPAMVGFSEATILPGFNPRDNEIPGAPKVLDFAQNIYQLLSLMSQVPNSKNGPISTQVLANVIGGNIRFPVLNPDVTQHTEVAYRSMIKSVLRGVTDYLSTTNGQNLERNWYPEPSQPKAGLKFNAYNLDPFVWFIHKQMGLSGYGFSLDDDTADVGGNFANNLAVAIGGLNGLPNQFEWTLAAPYGPATGTATVTSAQQITGLPPYTFWSGLRYNAPEKIAGANIQGLGVTPGAQLADFGSGGIYKYSFLLTQQPPTPSDQLKLPPLTLNQVSSFNLLGRGRLNYGPLPFTLPPGITSTFAPYMNALVGLTIPSGATFNINASVGNLTSYTQQVEEVARVSIAPTSALNNAGTGPKEFVANPPLPDLITTVNGTLNVGRVDIVDGWLTGTGLIQGNLGLFAPVAGYDNSIVLKPVKDEPVDHSWDNPNNKIRPGIGGTLAPGQRPNTDGGTGTPGKLTVSGSVYMYGATFTVYAKGAAKQGTDYSWLASGGQVFLGNTTLNLSLINFTPQVGSSLTIVTATKGVFGKFSQGDSITVGGIRFSITYNQNSVVLTRVATTARLATDFSSSAPDQTNTAENPPVAHLYRTLLNRDPGPAELSYWNGQLNQGATRLMVAQSIYDSPEHRGIQVDDYYQEFLNRPCDPQGRAGWVNTFQAGMSEAGVQAGFLTSTEYLQQHTDAASIVNGIFEDVLGRKTDATSLAFWQSVAQSPAGVGAVAQGILGSTEAQTREVNLDYEAILGRAADAEGLNMWLALLGQNKATAEQVELGLLTSDEFFGLGQ
jgi:hypothetical protein